MIGSVAAWRFSGFSGARVLPMLPQPVSIVSPVGIESGYGSDTVDTKGFKSNDSSNFISAISYGATDLR